MATDLKTVEHVIQILFNTTSLTNPFLYRIDDAKEPTPTFSLKIEANTAVLRFYLTTVGGPDISAVLGTNPIQWLSPAGTPTPLPSSFFSQRTDDLNMILMNLNQVTLEPITFNLEFAVVYQGRTYTSPDPTIINVQPPPPTDPQVWQEAQKPAAALVS